MLEPDEKELLDSLLSRLEALESELRTEIDSLKAHAKSVELEHQAIERILHADALHQQESAMANLARCEQRLEQVYHAMRRIKSDEYGFCQACDEPIGFARLQAYPDSARCLNCQQDAD